MKPGFARTLGMLGLLLGCGIAAPAATRAQAAAPADTLPRRPAADAHATENTLPTRGWIRSCPMEWAPGFYVVDGSRVAVPGLSAAAWVELVDVFSLNLLRGDEAVRAYGPEARGHDLIVIRTKNGRGPRPRRSEPACGARTPSRPPSDGGHPVLLR